MTVDKIIHTDPDRIDFIDELRLVVLFAFDGCLVGRRCELEEEEVSGRFRILFFRKKIKETSFAVCLLLML